MGGDEMAKKFVERPLRKRVVTRERDQTHSFILEEEVIGREDEKETIIDMLLNIDEEDQNVSFISIVGIGGLGKTTLAQYVYNDEKVKTYFDLKMWVCVSDVFDVKTIAEKIIGCATGTKVENLEMEQVQIKLREKLNQKKYLLVLDDVWNDEPERWSNLKRLLMGGSKGRQLTSLQTLPLFVVSKEDHAASSSKHCGGLARLNKLNNLRGELCIKNLAWVTDATLEAKAANLKEKRHLRSLELSWDSKDNNDTYVSDDENLLEGLQPYHTLKKLKVKGYRGVSFPSWLPSVTSLVKLKISDSMCQHLPPLYQLPSLRELFLDNMTGLEYISDREITDELELDNTSFKPLQETMAMTMNMSATSSLPSSSSSSPPLSKLKSLTLRRIQDVDSLPEELLKNLASLRSLNISDCPNLTSLPEGIGNLTSLQSLDISDCPNLTSLPEGIGNLTSLQSLDISNCPNLTSLPEGIGNLTSLQSLHISDCPNLTSLPEGIGNLTSLQSLYISDCPNLTSLPEGIGNLTSLWSLDISDCHNLTSLPEGIGNLTSLQGLRIKEWPNLNSLPEGIGKLTSLQTLRIIELSPLEGKMPGGNWRGLA
uniref:Uncharacterized protein n=1 Tax=Fagus sylvatica TaxID=28930 RepID=A0A2N9G0U6_FAGSY